MKKLFLLSLFAVSVSASFAQQVTDNKEPVSTTIIKTGSSTDIPAFTSDESAQAVITRISAVLGIKANFKLKVADVPNVEADIRHKQRYILYNPDFLNLVNKAAPNKWASIFILAHEIGHHLDGHTVMGVGSTPEIELEADEFAGFVLQKLGATLEESQLGVQLIANTKVSKTHPARADRMAAIEKGWTRAAEK